MKLSERSYIQDTLYTAAAEHSEEHATPGHEVHVLAPQPYSNDLCRAEKAPFSYSNSFVRDYS